MTQQIEVVTHYRNSRNSIECGAKGNALGTTKNTDLITCKACLESMLLPSHESRMEQALKGQITEERIGEILRCVVCGRLAGQHETDCPQRSGLTEDQRRIIEECDSTKRLLLAKNKAYGNAAFEPVRIFSKADAVEQLKVRIDDKLSRLMRGNDAGEDTLQDLIGYLHLLRIAMKR